RAGQRDLHSCPDNRGDRGFARAALVLGSTGDKNRRIERDRCNHRADGGARMTLVVDVSIREHGIAAAANRAGRACFRLGKDANDAFGVFGVRTAVEGKPGVAQSIAYAVSIDGILENPMTYAESARRLPRIAKQ